MKEIGIESSLVEAIRNGEKTIEGRLGKPRFLKMNVGDILSIREDVWIDGKNIGSQDYKLLVKITQILYFETFKEMLESIDFTAAVPSAKSVRDAVNKYSEFYSVDDEEKYGVVAIFFELIDDIHA